MYVPQNSVHRDILVDKFHVRCGFVLDGVVRRAEVAVVAVRSAPVLLPPVLPPRFLARLVKVVRARIACVVFVDSFHIAVFAVAAFFAAFFVAFFVTFFVTFSVIFFSMTFFTAGAFAVLPILRHLF